MLSYQDVADTPYTSDDQFPTLTPVALTLLVFLLNEANNPMYWSDWGVNAEEIQVLIGAVSDALLDGVV